MKTNRYLQLKSIRAVVVLLVITLFMSPLATAKNKPGPHPQEPVITYQTIPISMQMQAGAAFAQPWDTSDGSRLVHSGIGWMAPFGRSSYVAVRSYANADLYKPDYMEDSSWSTMFGTGLFCIYSVEDGDIYAFDGVMGNVESSVTPEDGKIDYVINVIVGGTGRYTNASGILLGRTPGRQDAPDSSLPVALIKIMEGYINLEVKGPGPKHNTPMPWIGTRNPQKWPEALSYFQNGKLIPISLEMEAGRAQWNPYNTGTTMIAGTGWIEPFGRSDYHYGYGFSEDTTTLRPDFMETASWLTPYPTKNLCIYHLDGGDIYAYDGIVGNLVPASSDGKADYIVEVIVGGTGDYEGATGMITGYTCGRGEAAVPTYEDESGPIPLPVSILKIMEGYIIKK